LIPYWFPIDLLGLDKAATDQTPARNILLMLAIGRSCAGYLWRILWFCGKNLAGRANGVKLIGIP